MAQASLFQGAAGRREARGAAFNVTRPGSAGSIVRSGNSPTSPDSAARVAGYIPSPSALQSSSASAPQLSLPRPGTAGASAATKARRNGGRAKLSEMGQQQLMTLARSMGASNYDLGRAAVNGDNRVIATLITKLQKVDNQRYLGLKGDKMCPYTYQEFLEFFGAEAWRRWEQAPVHVPSKSKTASDPRMATALRFSELPLSLRGAEARIRALIGDGIVVNVEAVSHWSENGSSCAVRFRERHEAQACLNSRNSFTVSWWNDDEGLPPPLGWEIRQPPEKPKKFDATNLPGVVLTANRSRAWAGRAKAKEKARAWAKLPKDDTQGVKFDNEKTSNAMT